jgi:hypothetical protein
MKPTTLGTDRCGGKILEQKLRRDENQLRQQNEQEAELELGNKELRSAGG